MMHFTEQRKLTQNLTQADANLGAALLEGKRPLCCSGQFAVGGKGASAATSRTQVLNT